MAILLIKEEIVIELKIPTQPMSEQLAVLIPKVATTKVNSMTRKKKIIKTKKTATNVVRIMINEEIATNTTTNPETNLETILGNKTSMIDKMTNPKNLNNKIKEISAGNSAKYATKAGIIGF